MATKPASGTSLNTGGAFYSLLTNAWAMLEGSGTTTADSRAGNTATFTSSPAPTWGSTAEGPQISLGSGGAYLTLASTVTILQDTSFSIAWGGAKTSGSDSQGTVVGSTDSFLWEYAASLEIYARFAGIETDATWTVTSANLTTRNDWCITASYSAGSFLVNLYLNGVVVASQGVGGANAANTTITLLGTANNSYIDSRSFIGSLEYIYLFNAALPAGSGTTGVATLATNPYAIFAASGPTTATLSGPTIGLIGVPSTNFTITLNSAAGTGGVSCPVTSSHSGDSVTSTPVVIAAGQTTGTFTVTPSPHNLGDVGTRNITLGTTTPSLTIAGSPIAYLAQAYYPAAMMLGL